MPMERLLQGLILYCLAVALWFAGLFGWELPACGAVLGAVFMALVLTELQLQGLAVRPRVVVPGVELGS